MKRLLCFVVLLCCLLVLSGCRETRISENATVTLYFRCYDNDIVQELTAEEAAKVIEIVNGNAFKSTFVYGVPSCGFSKEVSLKIGGRYYAVAMDTCNNMQDLGTLQYFDISEEGVDYIHALFEKYGGYFPCI